MARPREDLWVRINRRLAPVYNQQMGDYCYVWTGSTNQSGYGRINHNQGDETLSTLTHRLVYQLLVNKHLGNLEVDHICRNRACCNPDHLREVTKSANLRYRKYR